MAHASRVDEASEGGGPSPGLKTMVRLLTCARLARDLRGTDAEIGADVVDAQGRRKDGASVLSKSRANARGDDSKCRPDAGGLKEGNQCACIDG